MPSDAFPITCRTLLAELLQAGADGRKEINRHVMEVYTEPLLVYLRGHSGRWIGEPREIIHGFLADRLDRKDFFTKWESSGLRLRRWLMNALNFYLMECRPKGAAQARPARLTHEHPAPTAAPEDVIDRAFTKSIVRQALYRAQQDCAAHGLEQHWHIFVCHHYHEQKYEYLARELEISPARAAVMARTATKRFRSALRELVARDGAAPEKIDREIQALLEVTKR